MKILKVKNYNEMSQKASEIVIEQIKNKTNTILGLATGGTPEGLYKILVKEQIKWKDIQTFNLDEYIGIKPSHPMSYRTYMNENLFNHIDIDKSKTYLPSNQGDINQNGKEYDQAIEAKGGIDLQILGIGENGHIAFNEPGSKEEEGTREVSLTNSTIQANSRYFDSIDDVPKKAITMGIKTILKAKKIILLASGSKKAEAIAKTVNGPISEDVPSSFLQKHSDVTIIIDEKASIKI